MVSVIIPAYNAEKYLLEAVASVISQSSSDWELILVDDGSTDSTPGLCDSFAASDSRISVIHKPNGGLSDARNHGIEAASGEYLTFLDADDVLDPRFISLTLKAAADTGAPVVAVPFISFESGSPFGEAGHNAGNYSVVTVPSSKALEHALYQTPLPQTGFIPDNAAWGKLYARCLWTELRFTKGIWYEDMDIFYRLWLLSDSMAYVGIPLIGYRSHQSSYLHTFSPSRVDALDVSDRMLAALADSPDRRVTPDVVKAARVRRFAAHYNILALIYANRASLPAAETRCLKVIRETRAEVIANPHARLQDRAGALLASLGPSAIRLASLLRR